MAAIDEGMGKIRLNVGDDIPGNPYGVRCGFCKAEEGDPCLTRGRAGKGPVPPEKLHGYRVHAKRWETAQGLWLRAGRDWYEKAFRPPHDAQEEGAP